MTMSTLKKVVLFICVVVLVDPVRSGSWVPVTRTRCAVVMRDLLVLVSCGSCDLVLTVNFELISSMLYSQYHLLEKETNINSYIILSFLSFPL